MLAAGIAWVIGFALLAGRLATQRGRSVPQWMLFGAIIGPLAAVLLRLAPLGRCPTCEADVRGWEKVCGWCGNDVTGDAARAQPAVTAAASETADPPRAPAPAVAAAATGTETRSTRRRRRTAPSTAPATQAATAAGVPATTNGTRRRKAAAATTTTAMATAPATAPSPSAPTTAHWVASGVYLTGSGGLEPGARYSLELDGLKFIVRGPVDTDPNRISVACDVADLDASASGDRLVIDRPVVGRQSSFVLGFVGLAGGTPKAIAARIMDSAEQARRTAS